MSEELNVKNEITQEDIAQNKLLAILSYISVLVFVPLVAAPNSKFARFHANQGLILFVYQVLSSLVIDFCNSMLGSLPILPALIETVLTILGLVAFAFAIVGVINACMGKTEELPLIGKIKILK